MNVSMPKYHNVLVAIDLYSSYEPVINRALKLVDDPTSLSLIYVTLPYTYFEPYSLEIGRDLVSDLHKDSEQRLKEVANVRGIPEDQTYARIGRAADEIHELAEDSQSDLIVIGTHGQSGLSLLLGSTANSVLHGAKCDVLAVRV